MAARQNRPRAHRLPRRGRPALLLRSPRAGPTTQFFTWCDERGLELDEISPVAVAAYVEELQGVYRAPTIKQHLAAIRRLFDWLVVGQVVPWNPTAAVRCGDRRMS